MRGCHCYLTGWGRQWKKRTQVSLAKHMTGRVEAAGQPGMPFACRNWQGIRNCPCSKKKLLLVKPLTPKRPFSLDKEKQKKEKKKKEMGRKRSTKELVCIYT